MNKNWHQLDGKDVLEILHTRDSGIGTSEAEQRRRKHGNNELAGGKQRNRLGIFLDQFKNIMILILFVAAGISFISGEQTDATIILVIILGNAMLGYYQEYNAEQSIKKLQQMAAQSALVIRDGQASTVPASALVPGDIIHLEAGNIVPADARLLETNSLKVEEAALTGESIPVEKNIRPLVEPSLLPADQLNMIFKGTSISNGSARAVVTNTGMKTEVGKIASMLEGDSPQTPLQKRLAVFSKQLAVIVLIICTLIFVLGLFRGEPVLQIFLTALSLAVAALPEALPAVVTIALSKGAAQMVKKNALVRRLPAVETLGSITYICSDKTGTLTQNKMSVERIEAVEGMETLLLQSMLLNNDLRLDDKGAYQGDPTEIALVNHAIAQGMKTSEAEHVLPLSGKIPFDSDRMLMSTLHQLNNKWILIVKGAPARITERLAAVDEEKKEVWLQQNRQWASEGLRVLFFACRYLDQRPEHLSPGILEKDLELIGLCGLIDPPREEVIDAISECHQAGIATVMITGDQLLTAKAIALRLRIIDNTRELALTGNDLLQMPETQLEEQVTQVNIYARVSPEQKLRIVQALQHKGQFVAMTGDGVNDAPSLKKADIGIAMGITGTDVSKEAAHMILLDDNFASIVKAVKEGRRIHDNIIKFIQYVLACNLGEILIILVAPLIGLPIPLLPIHILWINLVTDGLPGLALASEPAESNIMQRPPKSPSEPLFTRPIIQNILATGIVLAIASLSAQSWAIHSGYSSAAQQTIVFTTLCFTQLGNALSVRAKKGFFLGLRGNLLLLTSIALTILLQIMLIYIPGLNHIFKTIALDANALLVIVTISVCCTGIIELYKRSQNHRAAA